LVCFFCALWEFSISPYDFDFCTANDLVGFGVTFYPKQLIKPIEIASMALRSYKERLVPDLPLVFS
jgi:hypothetical protein